MLAILRVQSWEETILLELVELVPDSHKPSVASEDGGNCLHVCRLWTAADMERLVERLEKAVERLENVYQGSGMCGDSSAKGKAQSRSQGSARSCAGLAQGTLWSEAGSGGCPVKRKTLWLKHFLSSGLSLVQVGGAAWVCGSLWDAPGDPCALFFSPRSGSVCAGF